MARGTSGQIGRKKEEHVTMSFRDGLRDFIKLQLNSKFTNDNLTFKVVNDATQYLNGRNKIKDNECIGQLNYGNEGREIYSEFTYYNGSMNMIYLVPYNDKSNCIDKMNELWETLSTAFSRQNIAVDYYASFNINGCSCDGAIHMINGVQYCLINVIGTYTYSKHQNDKLKLDKVEINGTELLGIASIDYSRNATLDSQIVIGQRFMKHNTMCESHSITITFIIDYSNTLHKMLLNMSKCLIDGTTIHDLNQIICVSNRDTSVMSTGNFEGHIELNGTFSLGNFDMMKLTITR